MKWCSRGVDYSTLSRKDLNCKLQAKGLSRTTAFKLSNFELRLFWTDTDMGPMR